MLLNTLERLLRVVVVRVGLCIYRDGSIWRADCHIVDGSECKSVVIGAVPASENWESHLTHVVDATLSCLEVVSGLSIVCVQDRLNVGRAIASAVTPTEPVVARVNDVPWLRDVMRQKFVSQFGGLDPYCVLDILKFRLVGVISDHRFDKLPELCRGSIGLFVSFLCSRGGRVVRLSCCECGV